MINIDKYAYNSKLKNIEPMEKFVFSILTLFVCLWADLSVISIFVLFVMGWVTVFKGGIPFPFFAKLLLLPMSFLIIGVITIAVNISSNTEIFLSYIPIGGTFIGISLTGLSEAVHLFLKSMGAVSCLYYLSLTTPMVDILSVFRRLKIPKLIIELMSLIYRFIFVLIETADTMFIAQDSRLGYRSLSSSYRSLGALASTLFIRAYKRSDELYTALEARGYDGELNVLEEKFEKSRLGYIAPIIINIFLIVTTLLLKKFSGGFN